MPEPTNRYGALLDVGPETLDLAAAITNARARYPDLGTGRHVSEMGGLETLTGDLGNNWGQQVRINVPAHETQQRLNETVLHELMHTEQNRRPGGPLGQMLENLWYNIVRGRWNNPNEIEAEQSAVPPMPMADVHPRR